MGADKIISYREELKLALNLVNATLKTAGDMNVLQQYIPQDCEYVSDPKHKTLQSSDSDATMNRQHVISVLTTQPPERSLDKFFNIIVLEKGFRPIKQIVIEGLFHDISVKIKTHRVRSFNYKELNKKPYIPFNVLQYLALVEKMPTAFNMYVRKPKINNALNFVSTSPATDDDIMLKEADAVEKHLRVWDAIDMEAINKSVRDVDPIKDKYIKDALRAMINYEKKQNEDALDRFKKEQANQPYYNPEHDGRKIDEHPNDVLKEMPFREDFSDTYHYDRKIDEHPNDVLKELPFREDFSDTYHYDRKIDEHLQNAPQETTIHEDFYDMPGVGKIRIVETTSADGFYTYIYATESRLDRFWRAMKTHVPHMSKDQASKILDYLDLQEKKREKQEDKKESD